MRNRGCAASSGCSRNPAETRTLGTSRFAWSSYPPTAQAGPCIRSRSARAVARSGRPICLAWCHSTPPVSNTRLRWLHGVWLHPNLGMWKNSGFPSRWNDPLPLWRVLTRDLTPTPIKLLREGGDAVGEFERLSNTERHADVPPVVEKLDDHSRFSVAEDVAYDECGGAGDMWGNLSAHADFIQDYSTTDTAGIVDKFLLSLGVHPECGAGSDDAQSGSRAAASSTTSYNGTGALDQAHRVLGLKGRACSQRCRRSGRLRGCRSGAPGRFDGCSSWRCCARTRRSPPPR